ncbi:transglutaminase TgpA family protein [Fervidibacillus albus]|uniref:DUF3488 and DUF4129 domain-containing transglutaminase family protein n=1 Tax=Fervidibacillus albus TaxID=2980026 RepID=A0A9E8LTR4_9BACI|nr:transglutaminaseTgpA domain-containing protein [Fervidibacillus albus]WAA09215.1 DUF3488 and DUF4129 domain-containing transglutaminase family protein [Fervidibacillus albus]
MVMKKKSLEIFILYTIAFLLTWEWLRPLNTITHFLSMNIFLFFLILTFSYYFLNVPIYIRLIANSIYIFVAITIVHFQVSIFSGEALFLFIQSIINNGIHIFRAEWVEITDPFRTLLFFILLWLLVYLLNYWITVKMRLFYFLLFTVLFLIIMDTFFPYNAKFAIIRTFILGFFALGLLNFYRMINKNQVSITKRLKKKWIFLLGSVILLSTTVGIVVPKADPIWPDPIPFIKSYAEHHFIGSGGKKIQKVGYDEDDSRLGGPFIQDNSPVFIARSSDPQYWRVETKDVYTGKGWEKSEERKAITSFNDSIQMNSVRNEFLSEEAQLANVEYVDEVNHIIYPYGIYKLYTNVTDSENLDKSFGIDKLNEKFYWTEIMPSNYYTSYNPPSFEIYRLRELSESNYDGAVSESFYEQYTQLPETLPERVTDLAIQLTEEESNWYDKAKAIEQYLQSYEFTYDTVNVAIPDEDEDYVDQFLFETKTGYCDNFSTSMVVMLRSIGVPARWVKGYTPGLKVEEGNDKLDRYVITNNNAHSWVEAYLPNIGWVPFEPTKGFESPVDFYYDLSRVETESSEGETAENSQTPELDNQQSENDSEMDEETSDSEQTEEHITFSQMLLQYKNQLIGTLITVALVAVLMYLFRRKWIPYWLIFKHRKNQDDASFAQAYIGLLKQLKRFGLEKEEGETLRNFAKRVDKFFTGDDMIQLTFAYERFIYRQEDNPSGWNDLRKKWIRLLKRTK